MSMWPLPKRRFHLGFRLIFQAFQCHILQYAINSRRMLASTMPSVATSKTESAFSLRRPVSPSSQAQSYTVLI